MLTHIPHATAEYVCLLCGARRSADVTDLEVEEVPEIARWIPTWRIGGGFEQTAMWPSIHYCPDGSIGVEQFLGFRRVEGPGR